MANSIKNPETSAPTAPASDADGPSMAAILLERQYILFPISFVILMTAWEGMIWLFEIDEFLLPAPSGIGMALLRGLFFVDSGGAAAEAADFMNLMQNSFYNHISHTLFEAVMGFFMGSFIGLGLGLLFMQSKWVEAIIMPYVVAFQTLPKLAIAPLFIIWFGYEVESKIFLAGLVAFFPLLVNTMVGLRSVNQDQLDLLRSLSASRWKTFWKLQFPSALPFIFAGFEIAAVFSLLGAILGEFVGAGQCMWGGRGQCGLGILLMQMSFSADTTGTFAILVILSMMGLGMHKVVRFIKLKVLFWAPENDNTMGT